MPRTTRRGSLPAGLLILVLVAAGLAAGVTTVAGPPAHAGGTVRADWGQLGARSRVLRWGCHNYGYRYSVNPPPGDWALETYLVHRATGQRVASDGAMGGADPKAGRRHFRLCRPTTRPGRYVVIGLLSVVDGYDYREAWVKPAYFRFRRR